MPQFKFNWVDVFFVTLLIRTSYVGFRDGFLPEFFRLLGLVGAFLFSFNNYTLLSEFLSTHTQWIGARPDVISFLFIFLAVIFIFKILAITFGSLLDKEKISSANKATGCAFGLSRGFLLIGLIYVLFVNSPLNYLSMSAREKSFSAPYISKIAPIVYKNCINCYPWKKIPTPLVQLLDK
jgi:membrane protein required for colicin V production